MSHRVAVAGFVGLLLLAGCGGLPGEADTTTGATTGTATEGERVIAAPPSDDETTPATSGPTGTSTGGTTSTTTTRTTTATYNRDVGYEVRASNADETVQYLVITITPENGSTPVFDDSMHLSPNESREFDFEFPHAGTYEVMVRVGDETVTRQWEIGIRDPDHGLSVYVATDGEIHVALEAI